MISREMVVTRRREIAAITMILVMIRRIGMTGITLDEFDKKTNHRNVLIIPPNSDDEKIYI